MSVRCRESYKSEVVKSHVHPRRKHPETFKNQPSIKGFNSFPGSGQARSVDTLNNATWNQLVPAVTVSYLLYSECRPLSFTLEGEDASSSSSLPSLQVLEGP